MSWAGTSPSSAPTPGARPRLVGLCGDDCYGYYFFSTHYAAAGAQGATKEFIDAYKAKYG